VPGGSYSALSGMQQRLGDLDRVAADLANIGTAGYKTERAASNTAERPSFGALLDSAIDVVSGPSKTDFRPGMIVQTGRDLDVAIEGDGFFAVETPQGTRYTRGGAFTRGIDGVLMTTDGNKVLGEGGDIRLPQGKVIIGEDGTVRVGAAVAGVLRIVSFENPENELIRETGARFRAADTANPVDAPVNVVSGALEQSNVSAVERMAQLTELSRAFEGLQKGVGTVLNELDARAIMELGKK
jgi:flagellar basal-body rod protein FlgF